jgi:hypothetical protein
VKIGLVLQSWNRAITYKNGIGLKGAQVKLFTGKNCNFPWSSIRQSRHSTRSIPANLRLAADFFRKCRPGLALALALALVLVLQALFYSEGCWAAGAESPLSGLVLHGPRDRAQIALTFDLCQVPGRLR